MLIYCKNSHGHLRSGALIISNKLLVNFEFSPSLVDRGNQKGRDAFRFLNWNYLLVHETFGIDWISRLESTSIQNGPYKLQLGRNGCVSGTNKKQFYCYVVGNGSGSSVRDSGSFPHRPEHCHLSNGAARKIQSLRNAALTTDLCTFKCHWGICLYLWII